MQVTAIVFDWAGTTIDHGCLAPASVFRQIFQHRGIEISVAQAREPMGMAKRDHIATIAAMPEIAQKWREKYGSDCGEADVNALYEEFLPLQKQTLGEHTQLIEGVAEAVNECRELGLKIGSSTGYTRELMDVVAPAAKAQGYDPDCVLCVEDAPRGRPAPYLLYEAAKQLDVYPMWTIIKVDDTVAGIQAGRNAGCWTVGVTRTGNEVGLSVEEFNALSQEEKQQKCDLAAAKLKQAGAHFIVESVAEVPALVKRVNHQLNKDFRAVL